MAERRGSDVDVGFTAPASNSDGSRPANVRRVDVYAVDGSPPAADADLLKKGRRVGSVDIKAPRDPNAAIDSDEPDAEVEPLQGSGIDQGGRAHVHDRIDAGVLPAGQSDEVSVRTYVGVAITTKGRQSTASKRVAVPLVPAPPAPPTPAIQYDEQQVTVSWENPASSEAAVAGFFVYDAAPESPPQRINSSPVAKTSYVDPRKERLQWGAERCYGVTTVADVRGMVIESELSPSKCVTLADTFPPKAPTGLATVPQQGAISLIWNANGEADLAGYLVLRGAPGDETLSVITRSPIEAANFLDPVESGRTVVYAVQAVDKAGNKSAPSDRVQETSR